MASETGATPEQVNNAIRRHCAKLWALGGQPPPSDERIADWINRTQRDTGTIDYWASHLVPPGALLLDPEAAAALRTLVEWTILGPVSGKECAEAFEIVRVAIGTPTAPVCPDCGERTYESPRTGRTCVDDGFGWRERE